ncbi:MAG: hypothetical protein QOG13_909 [Sphingomonadales bacterium]|jgi:hypothetical protein|nr:hypothetical protein [Sphingomonadales bacterium]MEA3044890.1 hypothetical protein [Sphingomonadales bacterium]
MRIRSALLVAALVAAPLRAQGAADAGDARAVIAAVLGHQASVRGPESGAQTCVVGQLSGPPAAPDGEDAMMPDFAVRIGFQWHEPDPPARVRPAPLRPAPGRRSRERPAPIEPPPALAPALADRLNALRLEAARAPAPPGPAWIDAALVPAPLQLQGPAGDCAPLTLSAPAFAGDMSFVEFAYACGTVCGNGGLYALQRREGRWEVVGIADIWIR